MSSGLIVLSFGAIALMRVAQKITAKKVSREVQGRIFFRYGGYYNLLSALFSLIPLFIVGFEGLIFLLFCVHWLRLFVWLWNFLLLLKA